MEELNLGEVEGRFAEIIWKNQPIPSGELVVLAEKELKWKKSTTYTMLRRLCQRGIFQNEGGVVTAKMTQPEFKAAKSEEFVAKTFSGSLPQFLTAFGSRKKLTPEEVAEIQQFIAQNTGDAYD